MDSIINRFRKIKNNRKNFALLQSCFKTAFFKIPKRPFVEKIENEIFL